MASSVNEEAIRDGRPKVKQVLADLAIWCEAADEAKPLFKAVVVRLQTAHDKLQRFYDAPTDEIDLNDCLKRLKVELMAFSIEMQRYFGVREVKTPVELAARWREETFAARVLYHKKLHRKLSEIHGGMSSSDSGLDRLFLLLESHEHVTEWIFPFRAAVEEFEKAVADKVENTTMIDVYKRDALLALEAVTLLHNAERSNDAYEWAQNEPAKSLLYKLRNVKDGDTIMLPRWVISEHRVSCCRKVIGRGSFGTVHYGTWAGNDVAVKRLVEKYDAELDAARRKAFIEEADLWFNLSNPHLLKLYGACHVASPPFFVCERSREGNLSNVLWNDKSRMWRLLHQSALAIEFLHDKNIVHGDLKLNNILVGADGCARVADFGMSRFKKPSRNLKLTDLDPLMGGSGAVRWRAPEALEAKAQIQSDVYSFAMCLIEAIGGESPYYNVHDHDVVKDKIRRGELPERPEEMDDGVWELVRRMTVYDRLKRVTIKEVIPELKKRADADLNSQVHATECRECGTNLEGGSSVCQTCEPSADAVVVIEAEELHRACRDGDVAKVRALLQKGSTDVNKHDVGRGGKTPLYQAYFKGHVQIVKLLLEAKADPNASAKNGETPLHAACVKRKSEIARTLLEGGANVHVKDKKRREPIHAGIKSLEHDDLTKETLKTLQVLVSYGVTWDAKCQHWVSEEYSALRLCMLLWAQEHAQDRELTPIPIEVIERGVRNTQTFFNARKRSRQIILRRKICLVGSSRAGKTSFVKSITSELSELQHEPVVCDGTIGIDHFPFRFKESASSRDETKIHEAIFWDFAGHEVYQVAHSLFFSRRTLYFVCVDLEAFAIAYLQAVIIADHDFQETKLLDEIVEDSVMRWVRMIVARQPDAEFVFIATKEDALAHDHVTEKLLKELLVCKLVEVNAITGWRKKGATDVQWIAEQLTTENRGNLTHDSKGRAGVATTEPTVVFVSCMSLESTRDARAKVEDLIITSGYSFEMPDTYSRVLGEIVQIREAAKTKRTATRISQVFAPVDSLPAMLKVEPELCRTILQTFHDLGEVLWYEDLDVPLLGDIVILDPLLLFGFIREVFNHKNTGQILSHADLMVMDYWAGLDNEKQVEAMKQMLQAFHLVYSADEYRVMEWDSDLIVPALWQTKMPASVMFFGDILRINKTSQQGEAVRVHWEFHFESGLPSSLFNHLVVASASPGFSFDAGPDWVMYKEAEVAACRIMVNPDLRSLHRIIDVEAVVSETASAEQVENLWANFRQLSGALVRVLREYPGLPVPSFAWTDNKLKPKENMKNLLWSTSTRPPRNWMPPAETWGWFKRLATGQDRAQTIEEDWEGM